jgi:hypothetical protein
MRLTVEQKKAIKNLVDNLFEQYKARLQGRFYTGKKLYFSTLSEEEMMHTLEGAYMVGLKNNFANAKPSKRVIKDLIEIAENYLEAHKLRTQNQIMVAVKQASSRAESAELVGKVIDKATAHLDTISATEIKTMQSYGEAASVEQLGAHIGIADPTIIKLGPLDVKTCQNCIELWHQPQNPKQPKPWKLSELREGYMTDRKNPYPTRGPTHCRCRHTITMVMPGYGFNAQGIPEFIGSNYDYYKDKRGQDE